MPSRRLSLVWEVRVKSLIHEHIDLYLQNQPQIKGSTLIIVQSKTVGLYVMTTQCMKLANCQNRNL